MIARRDEGDAPDFQIRARAYFARGINGKGLDAQKTFRLPRRFGTIFRTLPMQAVWHVRAANGRCRAITTFSHCCSERVILSAQRALQLHDEASRPSRAARARRVKAEPGVPHWGTGPRGSAAGCYRERELGIVKRKRTTTAVWKSAAARRVRDLAGVEGTSVEASIPVVVGKLLTGVSCPPTSLDSLCNRLGVATVKDDVSLSVAGELRQDSSGYRILCASGQPETRRRFTIAHELAHLVFEQSGRGCRGGQWLEQLYT